MKGGKFMLTQISGLLPRPPPIPGKQNITRNYLETSRAREDEWFAILEAKIIENKAKIVN